MQSPNLKILRRWWHAATVIAVIAGIVSCVMAIRYRECKHAKYVIAFAWPLGPPAWFIFERQFLIKWYGKDLDAQEFRDNADLAFKFWAGVAALLVFLYT